MPSTSEPGAGTPPTATPAAGAATRQLLIIGDAALADELRSRLPAHWRLTLITENAAATATSERYRVVAGDGTSALTLERAGIRETRVVVAAMTDRQANLEICRLARERFEVPHLLALTASADDAAPFRQFGAEVVVIGAAMATALRNRLERSSLALEGVGLGEGEILQITLHPSSPAIGRALRSFSPQDWTVAAVFRNGRLIIPHGDTVLEGGDLLLLIGQPDVLPAVGEYLRLGRTRFPLPYGSDVLALADGAPAEGALAELEHLAAAAQLSRIAIHLAGAAAPSEGGAPKPSGGRLVMQPRNRPAVEVLPELLGRRDCGCLCLLAGGKGRRGQSALLRAALQQARRPLLLPRQSAPYRRILLPLAPELGSKAAADVAFDLGEMLDVPVTALVIAAASANSEAVETRWLLELADERRRPASLETAPGNPLRQTLRHAGKHDLVALGAPRAGRSGVFRPDPLVYLAERLPCTTVIVPGARP